MQAKPGSSSVFNRTKISECHHDPDARIRPGDFVPFEALPTVRVLQEKDTVILDAAPIFNGYTVDTSHAFNFGKSAAFDRIDRELLVLRDLISRWVNDGKMFQQVEF